MVSAARPEWAGWLPSGVQALANVAFLEVGLIPLVEDDIDDQSVSLRRPGDDVELGIIAMGAYWVSRRPAELSHDVILYLEHPDDPATRTIQIVGRRAIVTAFQRYAATGSLLPAD